MIQPLSLQMNRLETWIRKTGDEIMTMLHELHEQGKTIIMVTHEPDIAGHAKSRLFMRDGKVERIEGEM